MPSEEHYESWSVGEESVKKRHRSVYTYANLLTVAEMSNMLTHLIKNTEALLLINYDEFRGGAFAPLHARTQLTKEIQSKNNIPNAVVK